MDALLTILKRKKNRLVILIASGLITLTFLGIISLCIGPAYIGFQETVQAILDSNYKSNIRNIVVNIRFPRLLNAIIIGAALSVAGMVMQALLRNPLVDPYILGVSSGAALGAAAMFLIGPSLLYIPIAAFLGGLLAFGATITLSKLAGGSPLSVVLAGIAVGTGLSSVLTLLIYFSEEKGHHIILWIIGSLSMSKWQEVNILSPIVTIAVIYVSLRVRELNAALLGEEHAMQLGVNVNRLKYEMFIIVALITSISVSFSGVIGFIGLVSPHICRMIVGGDHRLLLPASIIVGANMLLAADLAARTIKMPIELPLGAIISIIGVPFFIYLLIKTRGRYAI